MFDLFKTFGLYAFPQGDEDEVDEDDDKNPKPGSGG